MNSESYQLGNQKDPGLGLPLSNSRRYSTTATQFLWTNGISFQWCFPLKFYYLEGRETQRQSALTISFIYSCMPQMATTAMARAGQRQEPGTPFVSPTWVAVAQVPEATICCLSKYIRRSCIGSRAARTRTSAPIREASITKLWLNHLCCNASPCLGFEKKITSQRCIHRTVFR